MLSSIRALFCAGNDACFDSQAPRDNVEKPAIYSKDDSAANLAKLRALMEENKLDYYVVNTSDAHANEFVGSHDKRLQFLTHFSGSAGHAVISRDDAYLFLDGIYWVQGEREVNTELWKIVKVGQRGTLDWQEHLAAHGSYGQRIGLDDSVFSYSTLSSLASKVMAGLGMQIVFSNDNLVDEFWHDQPALPAHPVFNLPLRFAGETAQSKIGRLRNYIKEQNALGYLMTDLSEIAWLTNLRGNDISNNPLFYSFLIVTLTDAVLFMDPAHLNPEVSGYIAELKINCLPYNAVEQALREMDYSKGQMLMSSSTCFAMMRAAGPNHFRIVTSPVTLAKSIKNECEIEGQRAVYLRDAIAWVRWIAELTHRLRKGEKISEYDAGQLLLKYCSEMDNWFSASYDAAVQSGKNGALPHYMPMKGNCDDIDPRKMLVVDIGSQYLDATTDTTRTFHFNPRKASQSQRQAFTRVLQGHIALEKTVFPEGTTGSKLDFIARRPLWQDGRDYTHGTGHGIGSFLTVHEGPCKISKSPESDSEALHPGQILSNEPGYYEEGEFGVRIESAVLVRKVKTPYGDHHWLGFERLTRVPIQTSLVDYALISKEERMWLQEHNKLCRDEITPHLKKLGDWRAIRWLRSQ